MSDRLFLFVQSELPWTLGPPDGRYLLRSTLDREPEHVVVLATLGARREAPARRTGRLRRRAPARRRPVAAEPEPTPVATTCATIVDPVPVAGERQAGAWLGELDADREIARAFAALNRVLFAHRIATADPDAHEVSPAQALIIRAGWGEGEQVADGLWLRAVELQPTTVRTRARGDRRVRRSPLARASGLRPDERLAAMLGAREQPLLCEELALRARSDLDRGRLAHAAIELDRALAAALAELAGEARADLPLRVSELGALREGVAQAAHTALGPAAGAGAEARQDRPEDIDPEAVGHALGRLEAALRARAAASHGRA